MAQSEGPLTYAACHEEYDRGILQCSPWKCRCETTGHFDPDAEPKIWLTEDSEPITKKFEKGENINEIYRVLSSQILQ